MSLIEVTAFRLADGVDDEAFVRADHEVQTEVFNPRPGFVRRTTARGEGGGWVVITMWRSVADADAPVGSHPAMERFTRLVDPATMDRRRYRPLD